MGDQPTELAFWAKYCVGKHKHRFQEDEIGVGSLEVRVVQYYTPFIPIAISIRKVNLPLIFEFTE